MRLFPEPEHKRQMAESIGSFSVENAVDWFAAAELQEVGGDDDYKRAHDAWKAAEPLREQFAADESRERIETFRERMEAKAQYEFDSIWGGLIEKSKRKT